MVLGEAEGITQVKFSRRAERVLKLFQEPCAFGSTGFVEFLDLARVIESLLGVFFVRWHEGFILLVNMFIVRFRYDEGRKKSSDLVII